MPLILNYNINVCVSEETILDVAAKKTVTKCLDNEFYKG
jgi:hypothetical protein